MLIFRDPVRTSTESSLLSTEREYFVKKVEIELELEDHLKARLRNLDGVTVYLDTLDQQRHNESAMYLTVTGISAEGADSGEVGPRQSTVRPFLGYSTRQQRSGRGQEPLLSRGECLQYPGAANSQGSRSGRGSA
jgi:hypothetical protein